MLERAGYFSDPKCGSLRWSYPDDATASIGIVGGRDTVILLYRVGTYEDDWKPVIQKVPICWTDCRFDGQRSWFICDVRTNGIYCGRRFAKLYGAGRVFACRHCYRLGYTVQRGGPMDRAHRHLARLHRKLGADCWRADHKPRPKPKWVRWATYFRVVHQIEAAHARLDVAFTASLQCILT